MSALHTYGSSSQLDSTGRPAAGVGGTGYGTYLLT